MCYLVNSQTVTFSQFSLQIQRVRSRLPCRDHIVGGPGSEPARNVPGDYFAVAF